MKYFFFLADFSEKRIPEFKITLALEPRSKSVKDLTNIIDDLILVDVKGKNKYFELLNLSVRQEPESLI